ncbi:MAG: Uma2 family endonuclease, partial [Verrucomicrobiota bacterium]|nr:Uma2 family endonuclease [Verrucomicrobiota bacterium]
VDRVEKWRNYQTIPSLQAYVLVDQHHVLVHVHRRNEESWSTEMLAEKTDVLKLPGIGCELEPAAIYQRTGL